MANPFRDVTFSAFDAPDEQPGLAPVRGEPTIRGPWPRAREFNSDDEAARFFFTEAFNRDQRPEVRGLTVPDRAEVVPDLRFLGTQDSPYTATKIATYDQTRMAIPIFGTHGVVELTADRNLVWLDARISEVTGISHKETVSSDAALRKIAEFSGVEAGALDDVSPPERTFYFDEKGDRWHLAWYFKAVPAAPASFIQSAAAEGVRGHGLGASPRRDHPRLDYLVDAHNGEILLHYSAMPLLGVDIDVSDLPAKATGTDELGLLREFFASPVEDAFELRDPMRMIRTYDLRFEPIATPFPKNPVRSGSPTTWSSGTAAVSAHWNGGVVYDFITNVLKRHGIDSKGMELISVVNCTYPTRPEPPVWRNAVWADGKMWYGQLKDGGRFLSFSRYLDVIAHEVTHGITEHTAGLIYQDESGALNESFSDIFGIIIKNWDDPGENKLVDWNWQLGEGLGPNGLPLRDLSDPSRTKDPSHMKDYDKTPLDSGGVHTNSNIHNKAAYNVLTATKDGGLVFKPRDVAILYYLTLQRLPKTATFRKTLQTLLAITNLYYPNRAEASEKTAAIRAAYADVGITEL